MPFPLSLPSSPAPREVTIWRESVVAVTTSPFSLGEQVYVHPGKRWKLHITFPPMVEADAAAWYQFFFDMNGREGTFSFNLNTYLPNLNPAPGTKNFRFDQNVQQITIDVVKHYGFEIDASEVL